MTAANNFRLMKILDNISLLLKNLNRDDIDQTIREFLFFRAQLLDLLKTNPPDRILPADLQYATELRLKILKSIPNRQDEILILVINQLNTFLKAKISEFEHPS